MDHARTPENRSYHLSLANKPGSGVLATKSTRRTNNAFLLVTASRPSPPSREPHGQFPEVPSFALDGEPNRTRTPQLSDWCSYLHARRVKMLRFEEGCASHCPP